MHRRIRMYQGFPLFPIFRASSHLWMHCCMQTDHPMHRAPGQMSICIIHNMRRRPNCNVFRLPFGTIHQKKKKKKKKKRKKERKKENQNMSLWYSPNELKVYFKLKTWCSPPLGKSVCHSDSYHALRKFKQMDKCMYEYNLSISHYSRNMSSFKMKCFQKSNCWYFCLNQIINYILK